MRQKEGENMKDAFEKLFRAVHQFKKLNVSDLIPGLSSSEFSVMGAILQMGENGKITSSELAAKTKTLPAGCVADTARAGGKRICRAER